MLYICPDSVATSPYDINDNFVHRADITGDYVTECALLYSVFIRNLEALAHMNC